MPENKFQFIANSNSNKGGLSADGRFLLFASSSNHLVAGDTNQLEDLFLRDMQTGQLSRLSTDAQGRAINAAFSDAVLAADGKSLAFSTGAPRLVAQDLPLSRSEIQAREQAGETMIGYDVFVKNVQTGALQAASTNAAGVMGNDNSSAPSLAADGKLVAFESRATNLVAHDQNRVTDVFVKDLQTGKIINAAVNAQGVQGNQASYGAKLSADGSHLAFISHANNLVPGDTNDSPDIFIKNLHTGALQMLKLDQRQLQLPAQLDSISADGRFISFSTDEQLFANDHNHLPDVFVKDWQTGKLHQVSNPQANGDSSHSSLSADGRFISFASRATNLSNADTNGAISDIFIKDLLSNKLFLALPGANGDNLNPQMAADAQSLTFISQAANLQAGAEQNPALLHVNLKQVLHALKKQINGKFDGTQEAEEIHGSEGRDIINAAAGDDVIYGLAGNDVLIGGAGNDLIDGGQGRDTLRYDAPRSQFHITKTAEGLQITDTSGKLGSDDVRNVERIKFSDGLLAFDLDGSAGQAYRIYQAAFNRSPDQGGLSFWTKAMDSGATLQGVAEGFMQSAEFNALYGSKPDNAQLVTKFYANVLHRAPDAEGHAFWLGLLNKQQITPAQTLAAFAESAENQAALVGVISKGIELDGGMFG